MVTRKKMVDIYSEIPRNLGSRAGDTLWIYVIRCYFSIPKCEPTEMFKSKTPKSSLFLLNIGVHIWQCSSIFSPKRIPGGHPSRFTTTRAWLRLHSHRLFGPNWNPCKVQLDAGYRNLVLGVLGPGGGFNGVFFVFTPGNWGRWSQFEVETTNYSVVIFFLCLLIFVGLKGETRWDGLTAHSFLALFQLTEICGVSWCWKQDANHKNTSWLQRKVILKNCCVLTNIQPLPMGFLLAVLQLHMANQISSLSDFKRHMPPRNLRCIAFFGWTPKKKGGHPLVVKEFHVGVFVVPPVCEVGYSTTYMILITSLVPNPTGPWFWDYWIARRQIHHEMKVDSQWISHWTRWILHDFAGKCVFTGWNTFRYHNGIKRCFLKLNVLICSDDQ